MHIVVTGGAGFIGANLVRALETEPGISRITVLDDLSTGSADNLAGCGPRVQLRTGSVLDTDLLADACDGASSVVHLAARPSVPRSVADPIGTHHANVTGTLHVLEAARAAGNAHVVVASSSSVYGGNPTLPKDEALRPIPLSPYAVSKLAAETAALAYAYCYALPVLAFRFFNVFGPLQPAGHAYAAAVPSFLDAAMRDQPLQIHGDGEQTRDFTFVGSLVAVLVDAVRRQVTSPEPVNLAFGTSRSLLEVVDDLAEALGRRVTVQHGPPRAGDVRHSHADGTRLLELFPTVYEVPFEEGLRRTIDWFADELAAQPLRSAATP